jgi:hypothetical protein
MALRHPPRKSDNPYTTESTHPPSQYQRRTVGYTDRLQPISLPVGRTKRAFASGGEAVSSWLRILGVAAACLGATWNWGSAQANSQGAVPRVTELAGSRNRPGLFTQRLILPANFCGPVHTHDRDLHGLVLRGVLRMGSRTVRRGSGSESFQLEVSWWFLPAAVTSREARERQRFTSAGSDRYRLWS